MLYRLCSYYIVMVIIIFGGVIIDFVVSPELCCFCCLCNGIVFCIVVCIVYSVVVGISRCIVDGTCCWQVLLFMSYCVCI